MALSAKTIHDSASSHPDISLSKFTYNDKNNALIALLTDGAVYIGLIFVKSFHKSI